MTVLDKSKEWREVAQVLGVPLGYSDKRYFACVWAAVAADERGDTRMAQMWGDYAELLRNSNAQRSE